MHYDHHWSGGLPGVGAGRPGRGNGAGRLRPDPPAWEKVRDPSLPPHHRGQRVPLVGRRQQLERSPAPEPARPGAESVGRPGHAVRPPAAPSSCASCDLPDHDMTALGCCEATSAPRPPSCARRSTDDRHHRRERQPFEAEVRAMLPAAATSRVPRGRVRRQRPPRTRLRTGARPRWSPWGARLHRRGTTTHDDGDVPLRDDGRPRDRVVGLRRARGPLGDPRAPDGDPVRLNESLWPVPRWRSPESSCGVRATARRRRIDGGLRRRSRHRAWGPDAETCRSRGGHRQPPVARRPSRGGRGSTLSVPLAAAPRACEANGELRCRPCGGGGGHRRSATPRLVGGDFLTVTHMAIDVRAGGPVDGGAKRPGSREPGADQVGRQTTRPHRPATRWRPRRSAGRTGGLALVAGRGSAVEVAQAYLDDRLPQRADGLRLDDGRSTQGTIPGGGAIVVIPVAHRAGRTSCMSPTTTLPSPAGTRARCSCARSTAAGRWWRPPPTRSPCATSGVTAIGHVTIDRLDDVAIDLIDLAVFDLDGNPVGEPTSAPSAHRGPTAST